MEQHHRCDDHGLQVELQATRDFLLHAALDFHLQKRYILVEELLAVHYCHLQAAGDFHLLQYYILVEDLQFMMPRVLFDTCRLIVKLCVMRIFSISIIWICACRQILT